MCGFFQFDVIKAFNKEMARPPVLDKPDDLISGSFLPSDRISVLHQVEGETVVSTALWWLLLDERTLKPNYKYASFNSRSDRLHDPKSAAFGPYRDSRCLIPATSFVEGRMDKSQYFQISLEKAVICFGGLLRSWLNRETGELVYSASIITLPRLAQWEVVGSKSTPLMLPQDAEVVSAWLDPATDVESLEHLLTPAIREPQIITPIKSARKLEPAGDSIVLAG